MENMTAATPEPEDYTGEDGLLYCGRCRKPKEAYFVPDKAAIFGRDRTKESKEPPKKQPIKEVLQDKADEKKAQRTAPTQTKHRQQDMEL